MPNGWKKNAIECSENEQKGSGSQDYPKKHVRRKKTDTKKNKKQKKMKENYRLKSDFQNNQNNQEDFNDNFEKQDEEDFWISLKNDKIEKIKTLQDDAYLREEFLGYWIGYLVKQNKKKPYYLRLDTILCLKKKKRVLQNKIIKLEKKHFQIFHLCYRTEICDEIHYLGYESDPFNESPLIVVKMKLFFQILLRKFNICPDLEIYIIDRLLYLMEDF